MSKQKSKAGKIFMVIGIVAGSLILAFGVMLLVPFFALKAKQIEEVIPPKYASDYHLMIDTKVHVMNRWVIQKNKDHGDESLEIWNPSRKNDELDYMKFFVYDDAEDAREAYDRLYEMHKEYNYGWEDHDNYFISGIPGVCDAEIIEMFYLEENIIIVTEVAVIDCWGTWIDETEPTVTETFDTTDPAGGAYDRSLLENYIVEYADDIREYVLEEILTAEQDPEK